jgi:sugar lactone lactonase YvrE
LYVDDYRSHWVYSYEIAADGTLTDKQRFCDLYARDFDDDAGADGMKVDRDGRLYVSTRAGIQVCDQAGRVVAIIPTPNGKISNLVFGGQDFDTLYVTAGNVMYARKLKVRGIDPSADPLKPLPPKL